MFRLLEFVAVTCECVRLPPLGSRSDGGAICYIYISLAADLSFQRAASFGPLSKTPRERQVGMAAPAALWFYRQLREITGGGDVGDVAP